MTARPFFRLKHKLSGEISLVKEKNQRYRLFKTNFDWLERLLGFVLSSLSLHLD